MEQQQESRLRDVELRLLAIIAVKDMTQTRQIAVLSRVGFTPKEIAEIVGTTANTVRVSLVSIRKGEKSGKRITLQQSQGHEDEQR